MIQTWIGPCQKLILWCRGTDSISAREKQKGRMATDLCSLEAVQSGAMADLYKKFCIATWVTDSMFGQESPCPSNPQIFIDLSWAKRLLKGSDTYQVADAPDGFSFTRIHWLHFLGLRTYPCAIYSAISPEGGDGSMFESISIKASDNSSMLSRSLSIIPASRCRLGL